MSIIIIMIIIVLLFAQISQAESIEQIRAPEVNTSEPVTITNIEQSFALRHCWLRIFLVFSVLLHLSFSSKEGIWRWWWAGRRIRGKSFLATPIWIEESVAIGCQGWIWCNESPFKVYCPSQPIFSFAIRRLVVRPDYFKVTLDLVPGDDSRATFTQVSTASEFLVSWDVKVSWWVIDSQGHATISAIAENSAAITYENAMVTWFIALDVFGILLSFRVLNG